MVAEDVRSERRARRWSSATTHTPEDGFGSSVALHGDRAVFGAAGDESGTGAAYVFERSGSTWSESKKVTADDGEEGDSFGRSVDIWGTHAIVGAHYEDGEGTNRGPAYVFDSDKNPQSAWGQARKLTAPDGEDHDCFGWSVAVWGDVAIAGATGDDDGGYGAGAVSVFISVLGGEMKQTWDLDGLGNPASPSRRHSIAMATERLRRAGWNSTTANGVEQTRDHNAANEIDAIDGLDEDDYAVKHDAAGNMTTIPQLPLPGFAPGRFLCKYDAWNRLTGVYLDDDDQPGVPG